MLHLISDLTDNFFGLLKEDPVRPHIPHNKRIGINKDIFVEHDGQKANAITCLSYQLDVPREEEDLFENCDEPKVAVFYTIWSYKPGSGRQLIQDSVKYLQENNKYIKRFVTLSPKTEMAKRFHLTNGAVIFRENKDTINYEYFIR